MPKLTLQLLAIGLITISTAVVHVAAKAIVAEGFGLIALALILGSLPILKNYLD